MLGHLLYACALLASGIVDGPGQRAAEELMNEPAPAVTVHMGPPQRVRPAGPRGAVQVCYPLRSRCASDGTNSPRQSSSPRWRR
jgi:hypothetical protein